MVGRNRKSSVRPSLQALALLCCFLSFAPAGFAQSAVCGDLDNTFGPYDYRTNQDKHAIVERFHFNADVRNLRKGQTGQTVAGDLSYVLRAFPNHPGALDAISRLAVREKSAHPKGSGYSVDCWFERAIRFRPDDGVVRMLYGLYLTKIGKNAEGVKFLEQAKAINPKDANIFYNLGLVYVRLGKFDLALENAHLAYGLGFPLPGLKNQLVRAGKWREPVPASPQGQE